MRRKLTRCLMAMVVLFQLTKTGFAQDFRVYTKVFAGNQAVVARSLTIFHADKAYDQIDGIDEVIVFDPMRDRFIILNTNQELKTEVTFAELNKKLQLARDEYKKRIANIVAKNRANPSEIAAQLGFELNPTFDETFQRESKQLILKSPYLKYNVRCAQRDPEKVQTYLNYADWICRLNYVLFPRVFLPQPRLALNRSLREKELLPIEVELEADSEFKIRRRAEHEFTWILGKSDRQKINEWEIMLRSKKTKLVPFAVYQRAVLNGIAKKR